MLKFIQAIPRVVSRLVDRIDSPSVQDTILRIITCEEAGVSGIVEVCLAELDVEVSSSV